MNFVEYLKEDRTKNLYTIVNNRDGSVPREHGEPFKTWAVSPDKALAQIMHRMRETPDKYAWKVINNPQDYQAITWDQYKKMEIDLETAHMPKSPTQPASGGVEQLTMFDAPTRTTPY